MADLPISGLPNLTASTDNTLIPIVASGVTYNIDILDLWKSAQPFGTMYQDWVPDAPSAHTIGSIAYPLKSIYVSSGSVFIGPNNSLAIDNSGVLYSTNVFAAPTFQVGNVTSGGGLVTTSGVTFSVVNNEMLMISNSGGTITNLTKQPVPTGGTINQVLTQTGNTDYEWGWVSYSGGTSGTNGTSGSSGISGNDGTSGSSGINGNDGTSGSSGINGNDGTSGSSGISGNDGTSGSSGINGNDGTSGSSGSSGINGNDGTSGSSGISGTNGVAGSSGSSGSSGTSGTSPTGSTRYYGAFTSNVTQTNPVANVVRAFSADTTEYSGGVILSANTRFVVQNAGVYNIQFSAQLQQLNNTDSAISIWFRKNGTDIPRSNTELSIDKNQGGTSKLVAAWNIVESFTANQYLEIMWSSPDTGMEILWEAAKTGPTRPVTPSLIVTVTQV